MQSGFDSLSGSIKTIDLNKSFLQNRELYLIATHKPNSRMSELVEQENKINVSIDTLSKAAMRGDTKLAKQLVDNGVDPNQFNKEGLSPLMFAARAGQVKMMQLLVNSGADVNLASPGSGVTALIIASNRGQNEAVKFLIDNGADLNAKLKVSSFSALTYAIKSSHVKTTKLLLESGISFSLSSMRQYSANQEITAMLEKYSD